MWTYEWWDTLYYPRKLYIPCYSNLSFACLYFWTPFVPLMINCLTFNGSSYDLQWHFTIASFRKSYLIQFKSKNYKSNCDRCVSLYSFLENLLENALIYIEEILSQYSFKWKFFVPPTLCSCIVGQQIFINLNCP